MSQKSASQPASQLSRFDHCQRFPTPTVAQCSRWHVQKAITYMAPAFPAHARELLALLAGFARLGYTLMQTYIPVVDLVLWWMFCRYPCTNHQTHTHTLTRPTPNTEGPPPGGAGGRKLAPSAAGCAAFVVVQRSERGPTCVCVLTYCRYLSDRERAGAHMAFARKM